MIIKGKIRTNGKSLGNYLLSEGRFAKNKEKNERIEVWEATGFAQGDRLQDILKDFEFSAASTQCEKPLFHVAISAGKGEQLSVEQYYETINRLEERLNLTDHERVIVAHTLEGRGQHVHVVWNRIDHERQLAADLHYYKNKSTDLARELEREFGLRELSQSKQGKLSRDEEQQAIRHGRAPQEIKDAVRECWQQSDSGKAFAAALYDNNYILAAGDRRDFVIVDEMGGTYSVARLTGSKAAEVRERLADIERDKLPSVEEAKEIQFDRYHGNRSDREEMEWEDKLTEAGVKKYDLEELPKQEERLKQREKKSAKRHAHVMATIYSKADMVTVQQSAMRYLKEMRRFDRKKLEHRAERERLESRIQRLEKELQGRGIALPDDPLTPTHQQQEPGRQEQKPESQEARKQDPATEYWDSIRQMKAGLQGTEKEEKRERTEQTDYQRSKAERDALRDQLNPTRPTDTGRSRTRDDES